MGRKFLFYCLKSLSILFLYLPADEETSLVLHNLILFRHRILRTDHTIIAAVGISASPAADQRPMKLTDSPIIGIAKKR